MTEPQDLSYILNHLGENHSEYFNAVAPPIMQTSNFCFRTVEHLRQATCNEKTISIYSRGNNPTVNLLCQKLAALDGAEDSLVFASGMAAISTAVISVLKTGDHVVCVQKPYSWTHKLITILLSRFGVTSTFVDGTDTTAVENAIQPNTTLLYLESPNSMTFELQDLEAMVKLAQTYRLTTIMDNSYASPLNTPAIELGIDLVVYSATKYHGGHSDTVAGIVSGSKSRIEQLFYAEFLTLGGICSPMNAWLLLRSLRTLELRMNRTAESTPKVVNWCAQRPEFKQVIYPHHPSHPQHTLALKQMKHPGGLFSVRFDTTDYTRIERFCNHLKRFMLACSWGGHESLVFPACAFYTPNQPAGTPPDLVRFYIGLEDPAVLIADIEQALKYY